MENLKTTETNINQAEGRPDNIPEKFWDNDNSVLRSDDLIKSYNELEKKFTTEVPSIPESAENYEINVQNDLVEIDQEINARLHSAGFSNEQAQLVYDLALEKLLPLAEQLTQDMGHKGSLDRLQNHFGGKQRWSETERQIRNWGKSNLSMDAFQTMNQSYDGVIAMHRMMEKNEPAILGSGNSYSSMLSEDDLKSMMNDPRYWRDHEPAYVAQIRKGFEILYPSSN